MATVARSFFTRNPDDLKGIYQQIADELRRPSTYYLRATVGRGTGELSVAASGDRLETLAAPGQIELILDASGSMKRRLDGRAMIDVAKEVMSGVVNALPDNAQVALRFYGHRIREGVKGDCQDTELVFPFGKIDKTRMLARVRAVQALGTTPIDYTLRQIARDFGSTAGEKLVVLVTDGKEECKGDPAAAVAELQAQGLKLRLNIVGFRARGCGHEAGYGARGAVDRRKVLRRAERAGAEPGDSAVAGGAIEVLDAAGAKVGSGLTGQDTINVPEGIYTVVIQAAGKPITVTDVRVAFNGATKVLLKKEGQAVGVEVVGPDR